MKTKLFLVLALVTILGVMGACSRAQAGAAPSEVNVVVTGDDFSANNNIVKQVEVAADGTITVTLASNSTTGFSWSEIAFISNGGILQQTDHKYVAPQGNALGVSGNEVWTFKTLQKGTSTVEMQYGRPWVGGEKGEWTFQLTVVVK